MKNTKVTNNWKDILRSPGVKTGLVIVSFFVIISILAPLIAPCDPLEVDITHKLEGPSTRHWLGTDQLGRDIISRLIWGGRTSLLYGIMVLAVTVVIGVPLGLISGYVGGKLDNFIMRIIDVFIAMPSFLVALAVAGTLGASGKNLVFAMSLVWWSSYTRMARGLAIQIKEQDFMKALKAGGCKTSQIIFKHVIRNAAPSIISVATIQLGSIILAIAGFSFIGIGVQPPAPEWGIMLSDSKEFMQTAPELMIYPGILIILVVMAFNLIGRGIQNGISGKC